MRVGTYEFRPKRVPSLVMLVLLPLLISLGFWQLDRAEQKRELQILLNERLARPSVQTGSSALLFTDMRFRKVDIQGQFDGKRQYLLDNRINQGRPGYEVYTPLRFDGGAGIILVNRGWRPLGKDRRILPDISLDSEKIRVSGVLSLPPGKLLSLGADGTLQQNDWPRRVRNIDLQQIGMQLGYTMPPYVLQLDAGSKSAYVQIWKAYADSPQKNLSYAIQWFSMAGVLLLIYIVLNSRRVSSPEEE